MKDLMTGIISAIMFILSVIGIKPSTPKPEEPVTLTGYYQDVNLTSGEELSSTLHNTISKDTYDVTYAGLWNAYAYTDVKPGTQIVWDMYSNEEYDVYTGHKGSYSKEGDMYNREHAIPQSWFNKAKPTVSDLFHVYPTDGKVNGMRSDYLYGEVAEASYVSKNGSKLGTSALASYTGKVFEPIDEYKGDFARTYFYMAVRYSDVVGSWTNGEATKVFKAEYPYLTDYAIELFTKWDELDPVSEKEINRNNAVAAIQRNRNPFIDHPEFADVIFGGKDIKDVEIDTTEYTLPERIELPTTTPSQPTTPNPGETTTPEVNVDLDSDVVTIPFTNLNFGYTKENKITVAELEFNTNVSFADKKVLRIGGNKANVADLPAELGIEGKGGSLIMNFDIEDVKTVTFNYAAEYQIKDWYILVSTDGGETWEVAKTAAALMDSNAGAYTVEFAEAYSNARFALAITAPASSKYARVDLTSVVFTK